MIPEIKPYFQPHKKPQIIIGKCIGQSILPICGILPVKKGKI
jgi:hypothetical protein